MSAASPLLPLQKVGEAEGPSEVRAEVAPVKVFYSPRQSVPEVDSFSPSAGKPERVVAQWLERWPERLQLVEPTPVTPEQLALAHDRQYVDDVLQCRRHNGFGNLSRAVAESLPWTNGSLVSATQFVLAEGGVACSPTSGFHHAGFARAGGFCTFNGLVVAAVMAHQCTQKGVAILDCDYHYGNGTDDILAQRNIRYVYHYSTGRYAGPKIAENFLEELPTILEHARGGLLIYQAGADAHNDDPLGGWMTAEQMRRRDRIVFEFCQQHSIPVVWNLAGGYQEDFQKVLDLHHATMEECLAIFEPE